LNKETFEKATKINDEIKYLKYDKYVINASPRIVDLINKRTAELEKEFSEL
jgi:hypothetical protein